MKLSRRFVFVEDAFSGLQQLAVRSQYPTFSSYTTSFNFGFRTECLGMSVKAWSHPDFLYDLSNRIDSSQGVFVEGYMHEWARKLYSATASPQSRHLDREQGLGENRNAYALWPAIGTDRCRRQPSHLWHDSCQPADYAELAKELALPYTADDFRDPNQGQGSGEPPFVAAFLHIPKTAGGHILNSCRRLKGISHASLDPVTVYGQALTCIRNPFSRLVSAHTWIMGGGAGNAIDRYQRDKILAACGERFDKFCDCLPELLRDERMIHFLPQCRFLERLRGEHTLTILRFENLERELHDYARRAGITYVPSTDRINSTKRGPDSQFERVSQPGAPRATAASRRQTAFFCCMSRALRLCC